MHRIKNKSQTTHLTSQLVSMAASLDEAVPAARPSRPWPALRRRAPILLPIRQYQAYLSPVLALPLVEGTQCRVEDSNCSLFQGDGCPQHHCVQPTSDGQVSLARPLVSARRFAHQRVDLHILSRTASRGIRVSHSAKLVVKPLWLVSVWTFSVRDSKCAVCKAERFARELGVFAS